MTPGTGPRPGRTGDPAWRWVEGDAGWEEVAAALRGCRRIALDLESDGFHSYRAKICLIQIARREAVFLVDPTSSPPVDGLGQVLQDPRVEVIMHSADFDLRSLDRDYGLRVANLFDCSIAAAFIGMRSLGLGTVLEEIIGVNLPKSKRLQRFDWSRRPLPEQALEYAAGDVAHLFRLSDELKRRLELLGRGGWVREECERLQDVRFAPPPLPEEAFHRSKGVAALSPAERAIFREIYLFREGLAQDRDVPPFKVLGNEALLRLARQPELTAGGQGIPESFLRRHGEELGRAIKRGLAAPPAPRPREKRTGYRKPTAEEKVRLVGLKAWRQETADRLGLDPALIWPLKHLELLAATEGAQKGFEVDAMQEWGVRDWQKREFGADLRKAAARPGSVEARG